MMIVKKSSIFLIGLIFSFCLAGCKLSLPISDYSVKDASQYVYFARPDGGLSAYNPLDKSLAVITEFYDYHPNYLADGWVYFIRYQKSSDDKNRIPPVAMRWNTQNNRTERLKALSSIPFLPDLKNQVFFVDQGSKLLILNHFKDMMLIDIINDQAIPLDSMSLYFPEINYGNADGSLIFGWLHQYLYQNILKNKDLLDIPAAKSSIFSIDKDFNIEYWDNIESSNIFEEHYFGLSYHQSTKQLFVSKELELWSFTPPNRNPEKITEGLHPFSFKEKSDSPLSTFPLLVSNLIVSDEENYFIGTSNYLSYIDTTKQSYVPFSSDNAPIQSKSSNDNELLFDRLIFLGKCKMLPPSFFLVSMNKPQTSVESEIFAIERDQTDIVAFFSINDGQWINRWIKNSQHYSELALTDLNQNQNLEITNHYCASSFRCEGDTLINSRLLVWVDIYELNHEGLFELANSKYHQTYKELWSQLDAVKKQLQESRQLKQSFLCDEDELLLQQMLDESYRLASQ